MNVLLIVRSEIIASFILLFLIIYDRACAKYREGKDLFLGFALTALGHVAMGLATEITVNSEVPIWVNNLLHVLFFAFALWFSLMYFQYVLTLVLPRAKIRIFIIPAYVLSIASIVVMMLSKIEYLQGNGTKYSAGTGPTLCYILAFVLFFVADIILVVDRKKINSHILYTILPLSILSLGLMSVQIVVPEFLFTGCAITIVAVAVFFAIENPIGKFHDRAFVDLNTGIWNRNCYEFDIDNKFSNDVKNPNSSLIYVIGDLNGLKSVNDNCGHLEGDRFIENTASILSKNLSSAYRVYRIGGDEFVAVYIGKNEKTVQKELADVYESFEKYGKTTKMPVSISIGYAIQTEGDSFAEIAKRADATMYEAKEKFYIENGLEHRK